MRVEPTLPSLKQKMSQITKQNPPRFEGRKSTFTQQRTSSIEHDIHVQITIKNETFQKPQPEQQQQSVKIILNKNTKQLDNRSPTPELLTDKKELPKKPLVPR